ATGTATGDDQPVAVDLAAVRKITSAIHAIVDIDDAPLPVKSFTILPAVTGAAAVVHIQHRKAATGPVLDRQAQCGRRGGRWSTMTLHDQRRLLVVGRAIVGILRRVEETVRRQSTFSRKLDRARH